MNKGIFCLLFFAAFSILYVAACKYEQKTSRCPPTGEYQIYLEEDSILVFDGSRKVGAVPHGNSAIDTVFIRDNE